MPNQPSSPEITSKRPHQFLSTMSNTNMNAPGAYNAAPLATRQHTCQLDMKWVRTELTPFFVNVFGRFPGYENVDWEALVHKHEASAPALRSQVWEDFDSTVERVRLMLVSKGIMTTKEVADYGWISFQPELCLAIFVRYALSHGTEYFKLYSLADGPNNDMPRITPRGEHIQWMKFGAKRPRDGQLWTEVEPPREWEDRSKFRRGNDGSRGRGGDRGRNERGRGRSRGDGHSSRGGSRDSRGISSGGYGGPRHGEAGDYTYMSSSGSSAMPTAGQQPYYPPSQYQPIPPPSQYPPYAYYGGFTSGIAPPQMPPDYFNHGPPCLGMDDTYDMPASVPMTYYNASAINPVFPPRRPSDESKLCADAPKFDPRPRNGGV